MKKYFFVLFFVFPFSGIAQTFEPLKDDNKINKLISILKKENEYANRIYNRNLIKETRAIYYSNNEAGIFNEPILITSVKSTDKLYLLTSFMLLEGEYYPYEKNSCNFFANKKSLKLIENEFSLNQSEINAYLLSNFDFYEIEIDIVRKELDLVYGYNLDSGTFQELTFKNGSLISHTKEQIPTLKLKLFKQLY